MPNTAVAAIEHLHHSTVKDLDKRYMQQQLARAGTPAPRAIGVDEIAIRKGHTYRIVVSDLERARPIWFGGQGVAKRTSTSSLPRWAPRRPPVSSSR